MPLTASATTEAQRSTATLASLGSERTVPRMTPTVPIRAAAVLAALAGLAGCSQSKSEPGGGTGAVAGGGSAGTTGGTAGSTANGGSGGNAGGAAGGSSPGSAGSAGTNGTSGASTAGGSSGSGGFGDAGRSGGEGGDGTAGANAGTSGGGRGTLSEEALAPLPDVRQEHAVVALGGKVYVVGGFTPDVTTTLAAYDPEQNAWHEVPEFPIAFQHANAAAIGDKLYVAGFYIGGGFSEVSGQVFELDPSQGEWNELLPMPADTARSSSCVATLGTEMFVFGGASPTTAVSSAYDTATDAWRALPPLPGPREHCTAGTIDGKIYIAGGRAGGLSNFTPDTLMFDPATETYEELSPMPTPRGGVAGAVLGGRLFVIGGEGNSATPSGVFANIEAYDPGTDSWEQLPPMTVPRHGLAAATLDDRIYLPGGATEQGFGAVDDHSVLVLE